jgi:hypothetical protein
LDNPEVRKMRFLWPFLIPYEEKLRKMRGIRYFSTAGKYKMLASQENLITYSQEDSWQQV